MASSSLTCILNSTSGCHPGPELREKLSRILAENGVPARILLAPSGAEITELARRAVNEKSQIIVAGGGDGTVNAVAKELLGTSLTLGVLPLIFRKTSKAQLAISSPVALGEWMSVRSTDAFSSIIPASASIHAWCASAMRSRGEVATSGWLSLTPPFRSWKTTYLFMFACARMERTFRERHHLYS